MHYRILFNNILGFSRYVYTIKHVFKICKPRLHYKILFAFKQFQIARLYYKVYFITPLPPHLEHLRQIEYRGAYVMYFRLDFFYYMDALIYTIPHSIS